MQTASQLSRGLCPCLTRSVQQPKPRTRHVVMAAQQNRQPEKQALHQLAAAAGVAAMIFSAQPAMAAPLGPSLFESDSKNAQELQDIIAARAKGLPDLRDVPQAVGKAAEALKDKPLEKVAGKVKKTQIDTPSSVPTPLEATAGVSVKPQQPPPTPSQPPAPKKTASPQGATPAAPVVPSTPSAPAAPNSTLLGVGAVAVAGVGAFLAAGKSGQLPDAASQVETAAKDAAGKAEGAVKDAASKAEGAAKSSENGAEQTAEDAAAAAKERAGEAREWIEAWRKKQ